MRTITIIDEFQPHTATCDVDKIVETITPWFFEAPAEVYQAIADLEAAVIAVEPTDEYCALLGVRLQH